MKQLLLVFVLISIVFVNPIRSISGISFLHLIFATALAVLSYKKRTESKTYLLPFNIWVLIVFSYNLLNRPSEFITLFYTLTQYLFVINVIPIIFNSKDIDIRKYSNLLIKLGIILLIGGYVHYSGNYNIYGLINENIWSELNEWPHVRYRMVSFITSPQNYAAITYTILIISFFNRSTHKFLRLSYILLFLPQLLISGTRMPLIIIITTVLLMLFYKFSFKKFGIILLVFFLGFIAFINFEFNSFSRFSVTEIIIENPIYESWIFYVSQMDVNSLILSQNFAKVKTSLFSDILDPESFVIKSLYELGLFGILFFIPLAKKYISFENDFQIHISSIFIVASFLTPAFSGSIFPLIILPYLLLKKC